jgi:peptidoglycan/LPS O-acetylase OafA/YrhL
VSVFFVLSGFVISFVTKTKETEPFEYSVARLSRLYSVLVPSLILSGLVLIIAVRIDPQFASPWSGAQSRISLLQVHPVGRFIFQSLLSLCFLNSIHNYETCPGVNSPVWSLSFEAAYYAMFGIAIYARGYKRVILLLLCCMLFGVAVVRLMPVWLAGVLVQQLTSRLRAGERRFYPLGVACFAVVVGAIWCWPSFAAWTNGSHEPLVNTLLHGTGRAVDAGVFYYWGLTTSVFLVGAACLDSWLSKFMIPVENPIRLLASHTFSIYLFHFPLLVLIYVVTHYDRSSSLSKSFVFCSVIVLCFLISKVSEEKKLWWRRIIGRLLRRLVARCSDQQTGRIMAN